MKKIVHLSTNERKKVLEGTKQNGKYFLSLENKKRRKKPYKMCVPVV
jgi:hypothetical protein